MTPDPTTIVVVQDTPFVAYLAAIATVLAALATGISAWFIARQSKHTKDSVATAGAALREAQISRIEASVPRISVSPAPFTFTYDLAGDQIVSRVSTPGSGDESKVPFSRIFKLPRDGDTTLVLPTEVEIRNDGPGTVQLKATWGRGIRWVYVPAIPAGGSAMVTVQLSHTVEQWISLIHRSNGPEKVTLNEIGTLTLTYEGPRDADVTETHQVVFRGSILVGEKNAIGDWRLVSDEDFDPPIEATLEPVQRTYWKSRTANEQV